MSISTEWEPLSKALLRNKDNRDAILFAVQEGLVETDTSVPSRIRCRTLAAEDGHSMGALLGRLSRMEAEVSALRSGFFSLVTPTATVNGEVLYRNLHQMTQSAWESPQQAVQMATTLRKLGADHVAALALYGEEESRYRADGYKGPVDVLLTAANRLREFAWARDGRIAGSLMTDLTAMSNAAWDHVTLLVSAYAIQAAATGIGERQALPVGVSRVDRQIIGKFRSLIREQGP